MQGGGAKEKKNRDHGGKKGVEDEARNQGRKGRDRRGQSGKEGPGE